MMKATIRDFLQRAGGWCKPVKGWILPLSELSVMNRRFVPFIVRSSGRISLSGNLGGNAESFRPKHLGWKVFYLQEFL